MNLDDSPEQAAFRARVRGWLAGHAPAMDSPQAWVKDFGVRRGDEEEAFLQKARAWQALIASAGFAGVSWPVKFGGQGLSPVEELIYSQEEAKFGVTTETFDVGTKTIAPTIIEHCTDEQKARYLGPMLRGEEIWCQLFSEPVAGSDLAGLRTRAVREGDHFVVNGQKVWTSGAHYSDYAMLIARTSPDKPKHQGLTCFIVDMRTPGIEVRPLRQMTGATHFNEVFLENVVIPAENVFEAVDAGWRVINTCLAAERAIIGGGHRGPSFDQLRDLWRASSARLPAHRDALVDAYIGEQVLELLDMRIQTALTRGTEHLAETSVKKLYHGTVINRTARLGNVLQDTVEAMTDDERAYWHGEVLRVPLFRIAGGTDEIQRNILAKRVLHLPTAK